MVNFQNVALIIYYEACFNHFLSIIPGKRSQFELVRWADVVRGNRLAASPHEGGGPTAVSGCDRYRQDFLEQRHNFRNRQDRLRETQRQSAPTTRQHIRNVERDQGTYWT